MLTFFQESKRFFRKVGKNYIFCTKAKITVRKQPKKLFAIEAREWRHSQIGEVQAKKSIRRMPWHREPTKDVTNCDKLRGAVNKP